VDGLKPGRSPPSYPQGSVSLEVYRDRAEDRKTPDTQPQSAQHTLDPEMQRQLEIGRAFMKEYAETFKALAESRLSVAS
jgi:hypothetical protein